MDSDKQMYRCTKCGYQNEDLEDVHDHVELCIDERIVPLKKLQDLTMIEKISPIIQSRNFLLFWYGEDGNINYSFGEGMSNAQMAYMSKLLSIMTTDQFKSTITWEN